MIDLLRARSYLQGDRPFDSQSIGTVALPGSEALRRIDDVGLVRSLVQTWHGIHQFSDREVPSITSTLFTTNTAASTPATRRHQCPASIAPRCWRMRLCPRGSPGARGPARTCGAREARFPSQPTSVLRPMPRRRPSERLARNRPGRKGDPIQQPPMVLLKPPAHPLRRPARISSAGTALAS